MFIDGAAFTAKEAYAWISKGLKPDRHNFSTGYSTQHLAILAALLAQGFLNPFYKIEVDLKHYLKGKGIAIKSPGSSNPPRDFQLKKVADGFHLNSRWRCTILLYMDTGCQIEKTSPFFILKATIKIPNNLREMRLEQSQISIIKPDSNLNVLDRRAQNIFDFSFWPIIKNFRYQNDLSDYQLTFYED
jgi:hypothetical protein